MKGVIFVLKISGLSMIFGLVFLTKISAQVNLDSPNENTSVQLEVIQNEDTLTISKNIESTQYDHHKKIVAALLCVSLGPFGMHRLYLGTTPQVAAAYSATLGGIGILPLVDLFAIIFTKDLSRFKNNDRVMMWRKD